jgi:uncharacterized integral membrane protein
VNALRLALGILIAATLVVFGAQNTQSISFHFMGWDTTSIPVVLALAIALALGVLLAWIVSIPGRFRGRRERRTLQHQVDAHEQPTPPPAPPP